MAVRLITPSLTVFTPGAPRPTHSFCETATARTTASVSSAPRRGVSRSISRAEILLSQRAPRHRPIHAPVHQPPDVTTGERRVRSHHPRTAEALTRQRPRAGDAWSRPAAHVSKLGHLPVGSRRGRTGISRSAGRAHVARDAARHRESGGTLGRSLATPTRGLAGVLPFCSFFPCAAPGQFALGRPSCY